MAEKNTPLTKELLYQVSHHPEFESWQQKGKIPIGIIKELCQPLKIEPRFMKPQIPYRVCILPIYNLGNLLFFGKFTADLDTLTKIVSGDVSI